MKEALRLALGALQRFIKYDYNENPFDGKDVEGAEAITAIKEALAQPEQEPVAWAMLHDNGHFIDAIHPDEHARVEGKYIHPLYTTEQRTWVGLTDEEMMQIYIDLKSVAGFYSVEKYARDIEAKLRSKNNG